MRLLVFNAGSSSLKFDLIEVTGEGPARRLKAGAFVDLADGSGRFELQSAEPAPPRSAPIRTLAEAADFVLAWLSQVTVHGRDLLSGLDATVHRIVHGGEGFRATARLADSQLASLAELNVLAPLHNPPALAVIAAVRARLGTLPVVGVFDTAYYAELPEAARRYAVPKRWQEVFGVRRYGFHGTAHRYLCQAARARVPAGRPTSRVISLQLGRGCSVTATLDERAVATSMGFTPLEGLVMGTRSGDVDPGALLYVMERGGLSAAEMRRQLNADSGLLGLSGRSADMRELLALERGGDAGAQLAIEIFCRRARHYVAAYMSELGGVDVIAFGGGIGEHAPEIRGRILRGFEWLGIELNGHANDASVGIDASIAAPNSRCAVEVIRVDEASVLAGEAASLLGAIR
ncbi:MAG: acetate/propionate family kinase [Gammaproteobacteria bacterium]|nr:MAG: acetate/propionate family kinase [Gammaproteobacteria bacterium]